MRERRLLVKEKRTAHTNRIKGILLTQGIVVFDARGESADRQLDELVTGDGRRLGLRLKDEILPEIGRLRRVMEQLAQVDDERHAVALPRRSSGCDGARDHDDADAAMITALARIKGVGPNDASCWSAKPSTGARSPHGAGSRLNALGQRGDQPRSGHRQGRLR
jgi:transposase